MKLLSLPCSVIAACLIPIGGLAAENSIEFDTGRPRPAVDGRPVLGSGLAMKEGSFRGVPVGELSKWTVSLWFQAESEKGGDLFSVATNEEKGEGFRLSLEKDSLWLRKEGGDAKRRWAVELPGVTLEQWHHIAITCAHDTGPALFLDGKRIVEGKRGGMGYALLFDHYFIGRAAWSKAGNENFDGLIDDFSLYNRSLTDEEVAELEAGKAFQDSLVAFNDFENVNHRDLAIFTESDRDELYLDEGKKLYEMHCVACHSKDGIAPPTNPLSRFFSKHQMENGGDPFSMFQTVTYGFRNMMPSTQLEPAERYKVIHYIRERLVKVHAPDLYVPLEDGYADAMPVNPKASAEEAMKVESLARTGYLRDYGGALTTPVQRAESNRISSPNALVLDLGNETTLGYDLGSMRSIGAWTGGFLDFSNTLHHKLRAPGLPRESFENVPGTDHWRWAWDGKAENKVPDLGKRTVWPEDQMRYLGYYTHGDEVTLSYRVQGREVLESPLAEESAETLFLHRRLTVSPGENPLEAIVYSVEDLSVSIDGMAAQIDSKEQSVQAWIQGEGNIGTWRVSENGDLVLNIPASSEPVSLNVVLDSRSSAAARVSTPSIKVLDLTTTTKGGPRRWTKTHTQKGKLAVSTFQGYAMDHVPVPLKNAYNSWMRTASLAFFPDGRLAVATLAGDVWIVSGLSSELGEVTWTRFASGLYEPLGMKVIDGVLTAITRGRIVKLHDLNGDGEADFYEALFNEVQPDKGWHAYNFDLEVGNDGSLYYARTGGFSEWVVPGGIVRVAPDGSSSEVIGVGMRVPNGIGKLPDGRITFGDNQGTYVPASKIAITYPGAFHGAGKWDQREGDFDPEKITPPVVYMPQELDSSSGSQLWVSKDDRFGPLSGHLFHASFGRARTLMVMMDELETTTQGAVFSIPIQMESGTLRIAKNPVDGQLYYSGLTGWQAGGSREGSIQRLRYTGKEGLYLLDAKARSGQIELTFNRSLKEDEIDPQSWAAEAWNYRWGKQYGSPHFRVTVPGEKGTDLWKISGHKLEEAGQKLILKIPDLEPCHTLKLDFEVFSGKDLSLEGPIYFTIHELPEP